VVNVSGTGSGRVSVAGLICLRPGARGRLFYRVRIHRGRKGERRSMSEADYSDLIAAAHQHLHAPVILCRDNLNTHIRSGQLRYSWTSVSASEPSLVATSDPDGGWQGGAREPRNQRQRRQARWVPRGRAWGSEADTQSDRHMVDCGGFR